MEKKSSLGLRPEKLQCEPVETWSDWKVAWHHATTIPERLGLVHAGFDLNLNTVYDPMHSMAPALDTGAVTERYRYYLHIADVDSGYPASVRKRAFEVLFGSKNLPLMGIFPQKHVIDERELRSLLWFLRRDSSAKTIYRIRNCDLGVLATEGLVSRMAHERAQNNFWDNLQPLLLTLWFGQSEVADGVKNPFSEAQLRPWQKSMLLQAILYCCGVEPLRKETLSVHTDKRWSVFNIISETALEELSRRAGCFDELALASLAECDRYMKRKRFSSGHTWMSFLGSDQIAEFIVWLQHLKTVVIPAAEKELVIMQTQTKLRELQAES